jgi:competence protein ComEC
MFRCILAYCAGALALHALPALWPRVALGGMAILVALAGRRLPAVAAALAGFAMAQAMAGHELAAGWPCGRDKEAVEVVGRVAEPALERDDRTDFDLEVTRSAAPAPVPRRIRLAWYDAAATPAPGESWRFRVKLRCRRGFANPGAQDRELALLRDGIDATGYVAGDAAREPSTGLARRPIERLRGRIAQAIAAALPPGPSAGVLQGLAVGVRGNIPDALWNAFAVTGITHLIAISGLHVTGCAVAVLALLRLAWRTPALARRRGRVLVEVLVVVGVTAGYAILSGGSVPALRTLVTVALVAILRGLRRSLPTATVFAITALVLVAGDPLALTSAGFWLSFVATAALLAVMAGQTGWRGRISEFARSQAAITMLLTPVLAASFGRLSLVAPLVNAVAIPAFSMLLLPPVLAGTVLAAFAPPASAFIWRLLAALLDRTWPVLEAVAGLPGASWAPAAQPAVASAAAIACGFAALLLPLAGLRIAATVLVIAITAGGAGRLEPGAFVLTVVDVGQGLAALVVTARRVLVFDAGPRWRGGGTAARVALVPVLRARGYRSIDALIASHDDADHAGGIEVLERTFPVRRLIAAPGSRLPADETCEAGKTWNWDGVAFHVVHPPAGFAGDNNDRSCALSVAGPGGTALLLADPESAAENALATQRIAADVVLLPHHGSRTSSSAALVSAARARLGIASTGFGNRWGMPDPGVVARWRRAGVTVLDTATEGAITVRFPARPTAIEVESERRSRPHWWRAGRAG